jgi:hypothetical protein
MENIGIPSTDLENIGIPNTYPHVKNPSLALQGLDVPLMSRLQIDCASPSRYGEHLSTPEATREGFAHP